MIEWGDDGNDDEFGSKKPETTEVNGTDTNRHGANGRTTADDQDALLATMANRKLTVVNHTDHGQTSRPPEEQDLPNVQDSFCVVPRTPSPICEAASVAEENQPNSDLFLGHHDQNGSVPTLPPPLLRASTPIISDQLTSEGPMTPTNDAGPFVFDGGESARASL